MANDIIRPTELPARANPVSTEVVPSDNGTEVGGITLEKLVSAGRPLANQTEAVAGENSKKAMTPLTTKQAIDSQVPSKISQAIADLDLGTAAKSDADDFATAAQGEKADSALQGLVPGDNVSVDASDPANPVISTPSVSYNPQSLDAVKSLQAQANIGPVKFDTVAGLLADTILSNALASGRVSVAPGKIVEAQGFRYEVASPSATDHHVETAGGVKLYVLKVDGCWHAAAFGVVTGNWITDQPSDKVDSTQPMQAALNALRHLETLILPSGTIYTRELFVPYNWKRSIFCIRGEGWFSGLTTIEFLPGTTVGFSLGKDAYSFYNISFRGVGDVENTFLFGSIRDDNRVDMDWQFFNCHFVNSRHIGHLLGRGLTLDNCLIGFNYDDLFILDYPDPSSVILEPAGYIGSLEGGFRGFTVRNCRLHSTYQHIFRVVGNNSMNARGFTITGNQCDGYLRVIKGHASDVVFTGNNWYCGWDSADASLFDLLSCRGLVISGNIISNSTNQRQSGDEPLVRCVGTLRGLTIVGNTFVRRDVPILDADLSTATGAMVDSVTIADNTYVDCFVSAAFLVRIKSAPNLVRNVKVHETINGAPANWLAVDGDTTWRDADIRVVMGTSTAKQHNIVNTYSRNNERRSGAYTGTGSQFNVFVGYQPRVIRIYKSDGTLAQVKMQNSITAQPATLNFLADGFTVTGSAAVNTVGTVYLWETE